MPAQGRLSRRRRALLLAGLAIVLGGLAASNVAGREAALSRRIGGLVDVVVAREPIAAGSTVRATALAVRRVPARFAPEERVSSPSELTGQKAAVDIDRGTDMTARLVGDGGAGHGRACRSAAASASRSSSRSGRRSSSWRAAASTCS